ncbi:MAG TPA: efflux RND transporter periplasmic adaptor subunit [Rhizomicrobium sp.]|nr:efflux RND transporter periplasmic adaptor subunit [Rhizomicrobium sp.]
MSAPHADHPFVHTVGRGRDSTIHAPRRGIARIPGGPRTLWIVGGLILVFLFIWATWPGGHSRTTSGKYDANGPIPVAVAQARLGDVRVTLNALGAVTPLATVTVKPQVSGILQKIDFREGQLVRAGTVLAEIDPRPFRAALDQAKGALARDAAQYANAKIDLKRYQTLWAQQAISQQILATQEATVNTDAGTIVADKAAVEAAALNLDYCTIRSPVAGRVGLRQVDVGNYVQVGVTTEIVVVTELQPISVLFTLPEDNLSQLMQRVRAGAALPADAYDRSQTTKLASGTLSTVDNEIDPTTGTVKIRALFDNSDNALFPSQFVNVRLLVNTLHAQTTVPSPAIQHGASGDFVFVVRRGQTVNMRAVTLGPADGDNADVVKGVIPGEEVVVDGADRLRDGARVTIPGPNARAAGANAHGHAGHRHHHGNSGGDGGGP